jgi:hypothetical protein
VGFLRDSGRLCHIFLHYERGCRHENAFLALDSRRDSGGIPHNKRRDSGIFSHRKRSCVCAFTSLKDSTNVGELLKTARLKI